MKSMNDDENIDEMEELEDEVSDPITPKKNKGTYRTAERSAYEAGMLTPGEAEKQLTEFQRKLVHNIVYKSMTKATAARDAGSQAKTKEGLGNLAWETLRKPHVHAYMNYLMEKKNELAGVDKVEVIEGLRDTIQRCLADGKYDAAIKAYALLGSAIGLFKSVSQSTTIKKPAEGSSLMEEDEGTDGARKDLSKLINMIGASSANKKK